MQLFLLSCLNLYVVIRITVYCLRYTNAKFEVLWTTMNNTVSPTNEGRNTQSFIIKSKCSCSCIKQRIWVAACGHSCCKIQLLRPWSQIQSCRFRKMNTCTILLRYVNLTWRVFPCLELREQEPVKRRQDKLYSVYYKNVFVNHSIAKWSVHGANLVLWLILFQLILICTM